MTPVPSASSQRLTRPRLGQAILVDVRPERDEFRSPARRRRLPLDQFGDAGNDHGRVAGQRLQIDEHEIERSVPRLFLQAAERLDAGRQRSGQTGDAARGEQVG
ncbi:MAG: hypothetical protein EBS56_08840 [Planctomycetia bacterium]|nr:hypothetical protein [Planctomycetia bacterium]